MRAAHRGYLLIAALASPLLASFGADPLVDSASENNQAVLGKNAPQAEGRSTCADEGSPVSLTATDLSSATGQPSLVLMSSGSTHIPAWSLAYAACSDVPGRLRAFLNAGASKVLPGLPDFVIQSSPSTHLDRISCPVFLFHAADDSNLPIAESRTFRDKLQAAGKNVTLVETPTGDHYDAMIQVGIPQAIEWLKTTNPQRP